VGRRVSATPDSDTPTPVRGRLLLVVLAVLGAALLASGAAGRGTAGPPPKHAVETGTGGAVASVDVDATQAGIDILRKGGNAVDAAVAVAAMLGVTEPYVAGIGGGGFMVVYLARTHQIVAIDGRETAPQAFREDAFIDPATGRPIPFSPQRITSGMAVGVPGTLATWQEALSRYGTMNLARVLVPAIQTAERGFVVDQTFRNQTQQNLDRFRAFTSTRSLFLTSAGDVPAVGSVLRNPQLAVTYEALAEDGPGLLYGGRLGQAVVDAVTHPPVAPDSPLGFPIRPGVMTLSDLAGYRAPLRTPTHVTYRGYDVYGMPPPSSGGSTDGEALNILEGFDLSGSDRALALHRYLESTRLAFADRNRYVGDPDQVDVPLEGLLSTGFAFERRCLIGPTALTSPVAPGDPTPPYDTTCPAAAIAAAQPGEGISTNHLTVVDRFGNVVAYTNTIEQIGGSAIAVPGYGFLLNNELTDFDPLPLFPDQPDPNLPAPGKRPRSSMAPTIVLRGGTPVFTVGSPGGATIITTVLQILLDRIDFGMSLPDAIAAPRASQRNGTLSDAEPAFLAAYGNELTTRFGQRFNAVAEIGAATGAELLPDGSVQAVAEPVRRGGGDAEVLCPGGVPPKSVPKKLCAVG
jgi:gamma-glutamyltranspeptidase/glutathione hydrolase